MATLIDGPRLPPKSGKAKQLVVILHGYGADGRDLIALGQEWRALLPDAAFVAPNGPEPNPQTPTGRQWFLLTMRDIAERWTGVNKAAPVLDAFLDAELARHGLDDSKLAIVGFSQGTMMALHVGLRRKRAPACLLGYSGTLVGPEHVAAVRAGRTPPPILLVHGDEDDVIPVDAMFIAAEDLAKADIPCEWHLSIGIGHSIDGAGLSHGGMFIAQRLGVKLPAGSRVALGSSRV